MKKKPFPYTNIATNLLHIYILHTQAHTHKYIYGTYTYDMYGIVCLMVGNYETLLPTLTQH